MYVGNQSLSLNDSKLLRPAGQLAQRESYKSVKSLLEVCGFVETRGAFGGSQFVGVFSAVLIGCFWLWRV